jgi:uncharacterized protein YggE
MKENNSPTMKNKKLNIVYIILGVLLLGALGYGIYSYKFVSKRTITVSGTSKGDYANQIATFYINLEYHNKEKDKAVEELNEKSTEAVEKIKEFGIDPKDIKTQNLNVYQREDPYYEDGITKYKPNEWYASYSIEITLRDLTKSTDFTEFLTSIESSSMWGPNLSIDSTKTDSDELLISAIEDAKQKAERMAESMGARLGKVIKVEEGGSGSPMLYGATGEKSLMIGGGGAPIEPGSTEISKTVTVTFELK